MKYFGTDGIRGIFGSEPITRDFFSKLACIIEKFFQEKTSKNLLKICIGQDTRWSGRELFQALLAGFSSRTIILDCGILPTPAVAEVTVKEACDCGIMITASHNPATSNGIKFFNKCGEKLTIAEEMKIERLLDDDKFSSRNTINVSLNGNSTAQNSSFKGKLVDFRKQSENLYVEKFQNLLETPVLFPQSLVIDSANGATWAVAPKIFPQWGLNVIQIGNRPNGHNINDNCGSENPQKLQETVIKTRAAIGLANDGDGDRLVVIDNTGEKLDGDILVCLLAQYLQKTGDLPNNKIVVTQQSNLALDIYLKGFGIETIRCDIGDRNVYQTMLKHDCYFGGENSGHLIFRKFSNIGDGLTAAALLIKMLNDERKSLQDLKSKIAMFPQKSFNVVVSQKKPISEIGDLKNEIDQIESSLGQPGRVLVRYSGTEPKLRVLVEASDQTAVDHAWHKLQKSIIDNMEKNNIYALIA